MHDPETGFPLWTRRMYLISSLMLETGTDLFAAMEAVSSTAIEHPEWKMDDLKTWDSWEAEYASSPPVAGS